MFDAANCDVSIGARGANGTVRIVDGNGTARIVLDAADGTITTDGDIVLTNADCAEDFDIASPGVEAGTVMVIDSEGALRPSLKEYDKRVAGVLSGAGGFKPGITLDKREPRTGRSGGERLPIALLGKVYCKVDADHSPIEVGDLLTTSLTPGHAMRADDPIRAFGSVLGKALRPWKEGKGMIPILVALQ
ncbi:MAG TPA: hypothetical protein VJX67_12755 [Blastocatellia bacterium]|nr:hypothetical protein [Blastocatellia bacterium]